MGNPNLNSGKDNLTAADKEFENNIRPSHISDFAGQEQIIDNLRIFIKAAKMRGEALDHILFHGPPGLGKTTLSRIVANELGVNIKETSGPVIEKPGDLAGPGFARAKKVFKRVGIFPPARLASRDSRPGSTSGKLAGRRDNLDWTNAFSRRLDEQRQRKNSFRRRSCDLR